MIGIQLTDYDVNIDVKRDGDGHIASGLVLGDILAQNQALILSMHKGADGITHAHRGDHVADAKPVGGGALLELAVGKILTDGSHDYSSSLLISAATSSFFSWYCCRNGIFLMISKLSR